MIIALNVVVIGSCGNYPLFELPNNNETPVEQGVSLAASLSKCNLVVKRDYAKRLSILGFCNYVGTSSRGESLCGRSTIPMT